MNILAVDTTWEIMSLALYVDGKVYGKSVAEGAKKHNSLLLPAIEELLTKAKVDISQIDYFAAVVGPGSFTGIRIGVSCVNALAFACGKKCIAINALEELAYPYCEDRFFTAIDCRHNSYYFAEFCGGYSNMKNIGELTSEELESTNCLVVKKTGESNPNNLIAICLDKINRAEFSQLAPLYLKKSQAEREYESKNMDKTV